MKRSSILIGVLLTLPSVALFGAEPTSRPVRPLPLIERVLIVSIDGLRPDVLLRAEAPHLRSLMNNGAFTLWARTTAVAITLPSHVSMLTGVIPTRHGIQWNEDLPLSKPYYPKVPTIFELAHHAGYSTALISAKAKFAQIPKPGTVDWLFVPTPDAADTAKEAAKPMEQQATKKNFADDAEVTDNALRILGQHQPALMFVHYGSVDVTGHSKGWGSPEQLEALGRIDECLGKIIGTYESLDMLAQTAIIVSADHGGTGGSHGADDVRSRTIPWLISGPGIRKNYDLTRSPDLEVNTYDTFATACYLLGLHVSSKSDGKPVLQAIDSKLRK